MTEVILVVVLMVVWFVLLKFVFPRMGVST
jgi:hypothetical protein